MSLTSHIVVFVFHAQIAVIVDVISRLGLALSLSE
jgi:hypothetical protein